MPHKKVLCFVLFCVFHTTVPGTIPVGMFRSECHERHFWLVVSSRFLGPRFQFEVEGSRGLQSLSAKWAAECGYTMVLGSHGDLVLRVSYLACLVDNQRDSEFQLLVWFVNINSEDEETRYPLFLTCSLQQPWSPREIICEENYMEVSVWKQIPPGAHKGMEWIAPAPVDMGEGLREWRVVFRVPSRHPASGTATMTEETMPVRIARLLGYQINSTESRVLLRCAYGSRLAYSLQEGDAELEMVNAAVLYKHQWTLFRVDISVACSIGQAGMDGEDVLWAVPRTLWALVQSPVRVGQWRVGVGERYLSECVAWNRGYRIHDQNGTVEVRIPFGAEGGHTKSHVTGGQYSQSYFIDLFVMNEWEDAQWSLTQQRIFRPLSIIRLPRPPRVFNVTDVSEGGFSVVVGWFPSDVSLLNMTFGGQAMSWGEAEREGLRISHVPFPNNTHSYLLQIPFTHTLVSQKYLGDGHRRYTLSVVLSFILSPSGETFHLPVLVHTEQRDVVLPSLVGHCTQTGVRLQVNFGNLDWTWGVYVGGLKLDRELVELGGFSVENQEDHLSLEIPLYGPGLTYEGLSLQGLWVSVQVKLVHLETAEEHSHLQRCLFPVGELLVCLPDGRMLVLIDTSQVSPPLDPRQTSLLDPSCRAVETDQNRALFSFHTETCGTIRTFEDDYVIYTNEVRNTPKPLVHLKPLSQPDPFYRIPVGCVHPLKRTRSLAIYQPHTVSPPFSPQTPSPQPPIRAVRSHPTHRHRLHPVIRGRKRYGPPAGG